MVKFSLKQRISPQEREKLLLGFFKGFSCIKNSREAAEVLSDLLSEQELDMLAKRLGIARLLLKGACYQDISRILKVGMGTIARINAWLQESGEGFRLIVGRIGEEPADSSRDRALSQSVAFKRKYPQYFWPELMLEKIISMADQKEKRQLKEIIQRSKKKTELMRRLSPLLSASLHSYTT